MPDIHRLHHEPASVRRGNLVVYSDEFIENGQLRSAVVIGHGKAHDRKIVFLSDGHWTYRDNLRLVLTGKHDESWRGGPVNPEAGSVPADGSTGPRLSL